MKYLMSLTMAAICFTSGCASSVVTYDSEGKMIGKCEAKKGFILGAGAGCGGTGNVCHPSLAVLGIRQWYSRTDIETGRRSRNYGNGPCTCIPYGRLPLQRDYASGRWGHHKTGTTIYGCCA